MSVFKYFKNIPRSPSHRATGPMCNFFFQICNEVSGEKKRWDLSPPQRATGACRPPLGRQGPDARWGATAPPLFFSLTFIFAGTYFELFERVFVIIVGKISAANSYRT